MNSPGQRGFIPSHGHYQNLLSYQKAEVVYDLTFNLSYSSNQLPAGSANQATGTGFHQGRRIARKNDEGKITIQKK
jgi:hypothetical protein